MKTQFRRLNILTIIAISTFSSSLAMSIPSKYTLRGLECFNEGCNLSSEPNEKAQWGHCPHCNSSLEMQYYSTNDSDASSTDNPDSIATSKTKLFSSATIEEVSGTGKGTCIIESMATKPQYAKKFDLESLTMDLVALKFFLRKPYGRIGLSSTHSAAGFFEKYGFKNLNPGGKIFNINLGRTFFAMTKEAFIESIFLRYGIEKTGQGKEVSLHKKEIYLPEVLFESSMDEEKIKNFFPEEFIVYNRDEVIREFVQIAYDKPLQNNMEMD